MNESGVWVASKNLQLAREFLRREFRDCHHRDFSAIDGSSHIFLIETGQGYRHMLVIPNDTLNGAGFSGLCNAQLAETLKLARGVRVLLTPHGAVAR